MITKTDIEALRKERMQQQLTRKAAIIQAFIQSLGGQELQSGDRVVFEFMVR